MSLPDWAERCEENSRFPQISNTRSSKKIGERSNCCQLSLRKEIGLNALGLIEPHERTARAQGLMACNVIYIRAEQRRRAFECINRIKDIICFALADERKTVFPPAGSTRSLLTVYSMTPPPTVLQWREILHLWKRVQQV